MIQLSNPLPRAYTFLGQKCIFASVLVLTGCVGLPGPSVPFKPGMNLTAARSAVRSCEHFAPNGGTNALTGSYFAGALLGGLVLGPAIVASNHGNIRANGEANAVDKCLAEHGYIRRDLTPNEIRALDAAGRNRRGPLLDHLIGGGTLATFSG